MLKEIEQASGYRFFYDEGLNGLNATASLSVDNVTVETAVQTLLEGSRISWSITADKVIVLSPRAQEQLSGPQPQSAPQQQQTRTVSGNVRNAAGEGLVGAAVTVEGTNIGAITLIDGAYTINAPQGSTLHFNLLGYSDRFEPVNNRTTIDVVLEEDATMIDDVVVVGYGTQRRANLTGSVVSVGSEMIENKAATNLITALTGEAAGLAIMQRSGRPGGDAQTMRVRGTGTLANDAGPMVLIDGMQASMNDVHPNDVESVTVLKDAASAAIYGSRAANGVILITTKTGRTGKLSMSYNGNYGITTPTRIPQMANSWQHAEMWNEGMKNEGKVPTLWPDDKIARMKAGGNPDAQEGSTDWFREVLNFAAPRQMHQFSANGGNETLTYLASLGYDRQEGTIPNTAWERYSARVNTRAKLTSWFDVGINVSYMATNRTEPVTGSNDIFTMLARSMPFIPPKYSDGTWGYFSIMTNPLRKASGDYGLSYHNGNSTTIQINPRITLARGLVIEGQFGYRSSVSMRKDHRKTVEYEAFTHNGTLMQGAVSDVSRNQVSDSWNMNRDMTANLFATYDLNVADLHSFKLMLGASAESNKSMSSSAGRYDFPSNEFTEIDMGAATTATSSGNSTYRSLASLFGRLNYDYDGRYLFEANFRYDGSSKFLRGKRWGLFPSFSAGWRISEESFFEGLKDAVPNLKLRASWGLLGNQSIPDYQFLSAFGSSGAYIFDGVLDNGYGETRMGNTLVTWETSNNLNFGLDFALFRSRLDVTFDWFKRTTEDILLALPKPSTVGLSVPTVNAGSVENKGWEFTLQWRDRLFGGKGGYRVAFNLSDVKNKIVDMAGFRSSTDALTVRLEGQPIDAIYGWETVGIAMRQEDYDQYHTMMQARISDWDIGDMILKDRDGNNIIDGADKLVIGDQTPRYTFGLNLGFNYSKFDVGIFLQGVGKVDGYVVNEMQKPLGNISGREDHWAKSFRPKNPNYDAIYPRLLATWEYNYSTNQSYWVQNAAYMRLKSMQIGYTFELPKWGISKLRVNLSGENMFTLTKFTAWDPEAPVNTNTFYPLTSIYSVGVNITF
jgi:TonB-linked SusC/RagA family outer membrane protein